MPGESYFPHDPGTIRAEQKRIDKLMGLKPTASATPTEAQVDAECERIMALSDAEVTAEFDAECRREGKEPARELRKLRDMLELTLARFGFGRG